MGVGPGSFTRPSDAVADDVSGARLRLAQGRRAFLLPDGRAILLVVGQSAPLLLTGPGLADLLEPAAAAGLCDREIAKAAWSGAAGTFRMLLARNHLARHADPPQAEPLPPGVVDARSGCQDKALPAGGRLLVLLIADHTQPSLRRWAERAWQAGRTLLPIAFRPDGMVAGPIAPPGLPCFDCALRRQAGLRPIEAALWSGTGGARPLPIPAADLPVNLALLASTVQATLGRTGPPALRHSTTENAETWHPLHPGPGCQDCPSHTPGHPTRPDTPQQLLDALAPWIGPEAGLAALLPAAESDGPVRVELAREALRQDTDDLGWALERGVAACTGKSVDRSEARLGAVAEAIERGALLTALPEADPDLPVADPAGFQGGGHVVGRCLRDGSAWRVTRTAVQLPWRAGDEASAWFEPCGTAFGRDEADAIDRALLERLERDAVLRWWRRRALLPRLKPDSSVAAFMERVCAQLGPLRATPWLLDATTEAGLPVVVAVSVRRDGGLPILGFGAGWSAGEAAMAALRELVAQDRRLAASLARPAHGCALREWALACPAEHLFLHPLAESSARARATTDRSQVLRALSARDVRPMAVVHYALWPGGPCIARVVAPGLEGLSQDAASDPPPAAKGWQPGPYSATARNPWMFPS